MAEMTVLNHAGSGPTTGTLKRFATTDATFRALTLAAAVLVLAVMGGVLVALVLGSWPAWKAFGASFVTTEVWNPVSEQFGALGPIYGTLVTSLIAVAIAVPVGLGIAIFLTEFCPIPLRRPIALAIELLAGIPSIIYGIVGLFVLVPLMQLYILPFLIATLGMIPLIGLLFQPPAPGVGLLTASFVLAIMVLPFITAITRDVFLTVPPMLRESAYGMGMTTWEVARYILIPYTRRGLVGGVMLGLGRALGETMAVTFVVGSVTRLQTSIISPSTTISAQIANTFGEADGLQLSSLIALGLLLFVLSFCVLAGAKWMIGRSDSF